MSLAAGQALGHYEILASLGAGAMGEVYRAKDTRLSREVAIKVLPEHFADDEERLRRFEREARSLASLNHPNVAQIHGVDQIEDTCFLVLELVPGRTLEERIARGPLPVDEAVTTCRQIADGLEAAHEAGVIHRDLKPANVRITPEGKVKVLDFGLAKPSGPDVESASTVDSVLATEEGRLLGTPTYMAPEQARGRPIDRRVDVWAFGCVLYECLTGRRAFGGETIGEVLAAVLAKEPDWAALPASTPAPLVELLRRCLRKEPRRRLRDVGDARLVLEDLAEGRLAAADVPVARPSPLRVVGAVLLAGVLGYGLARFVHREKTPVRYVSVPITASNAYRTNPSWDPTGGWIALERMEKGSGDLYLRHVSTGEEQVRRAGPGDDTGPCWSPDGEWLAFVASDLEGTPVVLARPFSDEERPPLVETNMRVFDSSSYSQALGDHPWWMDSSSLLVSRVTDSGECAVWRIGRDDGTRQQLTFPPAGCDDLAATYSFAWDRILFLRRGTRSSRLMTMPPEGGDAVVVLEEPAEIAQPAWRTDGERIIFRSSRGGNDDLWQFTLGDAGPERLTSLVGMWAGDVTVSATDRIAYAASWHDTILTTLDLDTQESVALTSHAGDNFGPRFSPDGLSIAYHSNHTGNREIWVHELSGGSEYQVTDSPGDDIYPDWSPDGKQLVFVSDEGGTPRICIQDRNGGNRHVLEDRGGIPNHPGAGGDSMSVRWSPRTPAGELIGYLVQTEEGRTLWGIAPDGSAPPRKLFEGLTSFDWYLDCRRIVCTLDEGRAEELVAVDLETKEKQTLWRGPHAEIDVAPDGRSVMFCHGLGHLNMGLATLELVPPEDPDGLPTAPGEPQDIVRPDGRWHVHHGGWAPDSRNVVYVHDADRGNIYELIEQR